MPIPETSWLPVTKPNPDRRWWEFWKPKLVLTTAGREALTAPNDLLTAIPSQPVGEDCEVIGHICCYLGGVELHIDLSCEIPPDSWQEACEFAKESFAMALQKITPQVRGD